MVSLDEPELLFFPVRGSIRNVMIRHPGEPEGSGFSAGQITARFDLTSLFSKRVIIEELNLIDAAVNSQGVETGFINTLSFLFSDNTGQADQSADVVSSSNYFPGWGSDLASDWRVWVPRVLISSRADEERVFMLGVDDYSFSLKSVIFVSLDPEDNPLRPAELSAEGSGLRINTRGIERDLGNLRIKVRIGGGKAYFDDVKIEQPELGGDHSRQSWVEAKGEILFRTDERYDLDIKGALYDNYLAGLIGIDTKDGYLRAYTILDSELKGQLTAPYLEGDVSLELENEPLGLIRKDCVPKQLAARFLLNPEALQLSEITLSDLSSSGSLQVALMGSGEFSSNFNLALKPESQFIKKCLVPGLGKHGVEGASDVALPSDEFIRKNLGALSDAVFSLKGKLEPVEWIAELNSRSFSAGVNPEITGSAAFKDGLLKLAVTELLDNRGVGDQRCAKIAKEGEGEKSCNQISHLNLEASYHIEQKILTCEKLDLVDYPAQLLLTRLSPFLADEAQRVVDFLISEETKLNNKGQFKVNFFAKQGEGHGRLLIAPLKVSVSNEPSVTIDYSFDAIKLKLIANDFNRIFDLQLSCPIDFNSAKEFDLRLQFNSFPLDPFLAILDTKQFDASSFEEIIPVGEDVGTGDDRPSGVVSGNLTYQAQIGSLWNGKGALRFDRLRIAQQSWVLSNIESLQATISKQRISFQRWRFDVAEKEFSLSGFVDRELGWDLHVMGALGLRGFLADLGPVDNLGGTVEVDLYLKGPVDSPQLQGLLKLKDGVVSFPVGNRSISIDELNLTAGFDNGDLQLKSMVAKIGGGVLRGEGRVKKLLNLRERQLDLRFDLTKVMIEVVDQVSGTVSASLQLNSENERLLAIVGTINIHDLLYENNLSLADVISSLTRYVLGWQDRAVGNTATRIMSKEFAWGDKIFFDLELHSANGLVIDTNFLQAELRGDLKLKGRANQLNFGGKLSTINGVFGLKSNQFEVVTGEIVFPANSVSLDPQLNIIGETEMRGPSGETEQVSLTISGTLTQPKLNFFSSGGLSEQQIIGLFGLGADLGRLSLLRNRGEQVLSVKELISPRSEATIADRLTGIAEFSSVQIQSVPSIRTGEFVPKLIAVRPMTEDVDLILSTELGDEQVSEINMEYPLTENWDLITGWRSLSLTNESQGGGSGSYGVGLRYRRTFPGSLLTTPDPVKEER